MNVSRSRGREACPLSRRLSYLLVALALGPTALSAQPLDPGASARSAFAYNRSGFWLRLGFGYGGLDFTCQGCEVDREWDLAGFFGIGGTISDKVQIGFGSNGWTETEDFGFGAGLASVQAIVYPHERSAFFFQMGGGLAYVADTSIDDSEIGPGVLLGAGLDLPVSSGLAITAYGGFVYGWLTEIDLDFNTLQFGAGIAVP